MFALGNAGHKLGASEGGGHQEDDAHGEGDGHRGVAQEQQALGHLHIFTAVGLVAEFGTDQGREYIGAGGEVAQRHIIGAGDLSHERLGNRREEDHGDTNHQAADRDERNAAHATGREDHCDHHRHKEGVVAGQEDEFPRGEAGDQDVHQHGEEHDHRHLFAKRGLGNGDDGLVVGHDPFDAEGVLEDDGEVTQRVDHQGGTGPQNDKTHDGFDRALDALGHRFFLGYQANKCNQANQYGGL